MLNYLFKDVDAVSLATHRRFRLDISAKVMNHDEFIEKLIDELLPQFLIIVTNTSLSKAKL
jgi:hypothetical protein